MWESMVTFAIVYAWNIMALVVAPVLGFIAGQIYKINQPVKPSAIRIISVVGGITAAISFWFWPGSIDEAAKIALTTGIGGPMVVWVWFAAASKWAPKQAAQLKGKEGEDITIVPWLVKKKVHGEKHVD